MARPTHWLMLSLLASSVMLAGCPEQLTAIRPAAQETPGFHTETNLVGGMQQQKIRGRVVGPKALGNGTLIVGTQANEGAFGLVLPDLGATGEVEATNEVDPDETASGDATATGDATASSDAEASGSGYAVLQLPADCEERLAVPAGELPVQFATVGVKSYKMKLITELLPKPSDDEGMYYFSNVPAQVAFFLDVTYTVGDTKHQMFGLTRSGDAGDITCVKVDVASTLVARLLFRIWNQSNYFVDFRDILPRDYNPLLLYLRKKLADGMPAGITLDLSKTRIPTGEFLNDLDKPTDTNDSGVAALRALAAQDEIVKREIDRIYVAFEKAYPDVEFIRYW